MRLENTGQHLLLHALNQLPHLSIPLLYRDTLPDLPSICMHGDGAMCLKEMRPRLLSVHLDEDVVFNLKECSVVGIVEPEINNVLK